MRRRSTHFDVYFGNIPSNSIDGIDSIDMPFTKIDTVQQIDFSKETEYVKKSWVVGLSSCQHKDMEDYMSWNLALWEESHS